MHKTSKKKKEEPLNISEKPTKLAKNNPDHFNSKNLSLTEKYEKVESNENHEIHKLRQSIKELQSKNNALNTALAESQFSLSNSQVEIARLEKKNQDLAKDKSKIEELAFLNNKISSDLMKEKQKNKSLLEEIEDYEKKIEKLMEQHELKNRKILSLIRKVKEISNVVGGLKGKFFEKVDIITSYKETLQKIEETILNDENNILNFEEDSENDSYKLNLQEVFKDLESENISLRDKLEEMQDKFKETKYSLEKYHLNFEKIKEVSELRKDENAELIEENEALKKQITALEKKSQNQNEIIEILKIRIKSFEEEIEEEDIKENRFRPHFTAKEPINRKSEIQENFYLEKEIEDLDNEIMYIQKLLN